MVGGYIPGEILDNIRNRADIVRIISSYVSLQKKGKNYVAPCPFHHETEPSFTVTPEKQIFYCFGCNLGGNVFKFLMLQHNISFPEAARMLGDMVGVPVPEGFSPQTRERLRQEEKAWKINSLASEFFHNVLLRHPGAEAARMYLKNRGVAIDTIKNFNLGYALAEWDALIRFMKDKGVGAGNLVDVGLAVSNNNKTYDRFRSRLMFPINDSRGRVTGFGGRVLDQSNPKYLNTPETDYFNKGKILYGLDKARQHIREAGYVIITEGYMDAITAHQYGIKNTVASLGTSLTREHGKLLASQTREVIIAYDADAAGMAAALRGLDILQEAGCRVRVLHLPEGKDPDEFLRARGHEEWQHQVEKAMPLVEFKLQMALEKYKNVAASKDAILEEVLPNVAAISAELEKTEAIQMVASRLYTSFHAVAEELHRFCKNNPKKRTNPDKIAKNKHNIIRKNRIKFGDKAEYGLLRIMLEDASTITKVASEIKGNFFIDTFCSCVYDHLLEISASSFYSPSALFDRLEEEHQQKLGMLLMEPIPGEDIKALLPGYIAAIKRKRLLQYRNELVIALANAEKSGNSEEVDRILHEISIADKP
ncbi:DNA primase [Desulfotruncus alcoholivorax]|uniref:DNA primase n=1 Tax=Desulfotruncus alcoholivorax TaxID=265477 RepID=UPI00146FBE18|nr:DNA primase [Desulfotruncus alcoholivorax]